MVRRRVSAAGGAPLRGLAAAGAALLLAGLPAAPAVADEDASDEHTLTMAVSQEVDTLNPFTAIRLISTSAMRLQYNYLTMYDPETDEVIPGLATEWEPGEDEDGEVDPSVWTYQLRDDVTFSDGEDFDADDVVWTFNTMKEEEDGANIALANYVKNLEEVTALGEHEVQLTFDEPVALGEHMRIPILPEHVWSEIDDLDEFTPTEEDDFPVVGTGPYELTEYVAGQRLVYEANEDYFDGRASFDRVVMEYYDEQDAQVEALRSGDVDFIQSLTPAQTEELSGDDGGDIVVSEGIGRRFLGFTVNPGAEARNGDEIGDGHPALQDRDVRQAIMHAIDKDDIVDRVYGGLAEPAEGNIPARFENFYHVPEGDDRVDFDPELAEEMLDDAGYEMGDDGVRESPDGDPLEFRMIVHLDDPDRVRTGESMVEWLGDIGIEVDQQNVDSGEVGEYLDAGEYDLIFTGWSVNPDPDSILELHTCDARPEEPGDGMSTDSWFCNEEYDDLYAAQSVEVDPDERAAIIQDMQAVLYDEAVVNTLVYPRQVEAYRSDVIEEGSMTPHPDPDGIFYGQDDMWSWWTAEPAETDAGSGLSTTTLVAIGGAVVVVVAGVGFVLWRRSATAGDRE